MTTKTCPRCNLVNPSDAQVCVCGHAFVDSREGEIEAIRESLRQHEQPKGPKTPKKALNLLLVVGLVWITGLAASLLLAKAFTAGTTLELFALFAGLTWIGAPCLGIGLYRYWKATKRGSSAVT